MSDYSPDPSPRTTLISLIIVAALPFWVAVLLYNTRPQPVAITLNPPLPTMTPLPTETPGPVTVYITGAVATPELLVSLPAGSRAEDAIAAAGGALDNADLSGVNLALILRDGDQIHVPAVDTAAVVLPTANAPGIVNVNTASTAELELLPGVGPALAEAIVVYREENGPFADFAALDEVSGVGPVLLENWEGLVVFE